jgi:hypothetical protein
MLDVTLATPQQHHTLTVFPLVTSAPVELPYALLVDALHGGVLQITEVGSGTVPELFAINDGATPILVLDGEQLIGARQNRMTNRTMLLPAHSKTRIPVSCMEQGRWHFDSDQFSPSPQHSPGKVRRQAREVEADYTRRGAPMPQDALAQAQAKVWASIAEHSAAVGGHSQTGALNDLYQSRAADLEEWVRSFPSVDQQVGLLAFVGARPLGMDVIGGGELYTRLHDRLLRGYIMDALGTRARTAAVTETKAQKFLDGVRSAERVESPTVGEGTYSVLTGTVVGGELMDRNQIVHLSAFPASERRGPDGSGHTAERSNDPVPPPSYRRRRRAE